MVQNTAVESLIDSFERGLINGRARWVADLSEFIRRFRIRETTSDLYAKGRTRNRGMLISRFFAWSVLPDYNVALLCVNGGRGGAFSMDRMRSLTADALSFVERDGLQWVWLVILLTGPLPSAVVAFVERYERKELGVAVASVTTGQTSTSSNKIGTSIPGHLGLGKLIERASHGEAV